MKQKLLQIYFDILTWLFFWSASKLYSVVHFYAPPVEGVPDGENDVKAVLLADRRIDAFRACEETMQAIAGEGDWLILREGDQWKDGDVYGFGYIFVVGNPNSAVHAGETILPHMLDYLPRRPYRCEACE